MSDPTTPAQPAPEPEDAFGPEFLPDPAPEGAAPPRPEPRTPAPETPEHLEPGDAPPGWLPPQPPRPLVPPRLTGPRKGRRLRKPPAEPRRRLTGAQRLLLLDAWDRSGLPAKDFAALVGVTRHVLYSWRKKLRDHAAGAGSRTSPSARSC